MSKSTTQILILPGEAGWEIWTCPPGGAFALHRATDLSRAGELEDVPAGDLTMLFALRSVTTVPLRVMTTDAALFEDLATLHAERLGLRADPDAGQLNDLLEVAREEESTVLLSLWLKPPREGELPPSGPRAFDLSARALPVEGDAIAVWRELGRWVFALHQGGRLLYAQATACDAGHPDEAFARELKLALMQLSLQGLDPRPHRLVVWSPDPVCNLAALRQAFELPVEIRERPLPVLPALTSKLLPEDVRAARRESRRRQRIRVAVAAVLLLYLGMVAWLAFGLWRDSRRVAALEREARQAAPDADAYATHMKKWNELADAVRIDHSPVEILHRVAGCIPPEGGLRLATADVSPGKLQLVGEAPALQAVNRFSLKLSKHQGLKRYDWSIPEPKQSARGWEFRYQGDVPVDPSAAP